MLPRLRFSPTSVLVAAFALVGAVFVWHEANARRSASLERLGAALFSDASLSRDGAVSCATCHDPRRAFADGRPTSVALGTGTRNAPSIEHVGRLRVLMWDGRHERLEDQVLEPFTNPIEHGLPSEGTLLDLVNRSSRLRPLIAPACGSAASRACVRDALAAYLRTLRGPESAFERFERDPGGAAITASAQRGWALFQGAANCSSCHSVGSKGSRLFTDERFHPAGLRDHALLTNLARSSNPSDWARRVLEDRGVAALGRFNVTRDLADLGLFRTPGLRGVSRTAPYMHDGSVPTLEAALEYELYYRPRDGVPILLTPQEKADVVAFLKTL